MAAPPPPPPPRGGMSLYANLLDTDGGASISRGPVLFKDEKDDAPKKPLDPGACCLLPHISQTPPI